ncbi:MAG: carbohydrate-binding protein, partial [Verrucomicrobia bacterium]|nr:carbohydrate-binding protein [Verrucomicrobiota bacterium]
TSDDIYIDSTDLSTPDLPDIVTSYAYVADRKPANPNAFFNIVDYGAQKMGAIPSESHNNKSDIQDAIDDAVAAGGGTVFIPTGHWYVEGSLTIKTGVELRGLIHSHIAAASNQTPLIVMEANSGVRRVSIYYPDISVDDWTNKHAVSIQVKGADVYIRDVRLGNSWDGIDVGNAICDRYEIVGCVGNPRNVGIYAGKGSADGRQENNIFTHDGDNWATGEEGVARYTARLPFQYVDVDGDISFNNHAFFPQPANPPLGSEFPTVSIADGVAIEVAHSDADVLFLQTHTDAGYLADIKSGANVTFVDAGSIFRGIKVASSFSGTLDVFSSYFGDATDILTVDNGAQGAVNIVQGAASQGNAEEPKMTLQGGDTAINNFMFRSERCSLSDIQVLHTGGEATIEGCAGFGGLRSPGGAVHKYNIRYEQSIVVNDCDLRYPLISATSTYDDGGNWVYDVWNCVEGDTSTLPSPEVSWSSDDVGVVGVPQYVTIDFGGPRKIYGYNLYTSSQNVALKKYNFQYLDRGTWRTYHSVPNNTSTLIEYGTSIPIITSRVRVECLEGPAAQPQFFRINEIQVFGQLNDSEQIGDVLKLDVRTSYYPESDPSHRYFYITAVDFPDGGYQWQSGDYIEYDVTLSTEVGGLGGIDIYNTDTNVFRDSGWVDQEQMSGHPGTDISGEAYGSWYHRKLQVPGGMVGRVGKYLDLAMDVSTTSGVRFEAYYDNILVTDGNGNTKLTLFNNGAALDFGQRINAGPFIAQGIEHEESSVSAADSPIISGSEFKKTHVISSTSRTKIQMEDFDVGGEGIAFHDTTSLNLGGSYRTDEAVDIIAQGSAKYIGWIEPEEWLTYNIRVEESGIYSINARYSTESGSTDAQCDLALDGQALDGIKHFPATSGWTDFQTVKLWKVFLPAGVHTLEFYAYTAGFNIDWLRLMPLIESDFVFDLPGVIEMEDYHPGGEGVAFYDLVETINLGGAYRNDAVDIGTNGAGYAIGWTVDGETLKYKVHIQTEGFYDIDCWYTSPATGGQWRLKCDGEYVTESQVMPGTGGWSNYSLYECNGVLLPKGEHVLEFCIESRYYFNVDSLSFALAP